MLLYEYPKRDPVSKRNREFQKHEDKRKNKKLLIRNVLVSSIIVLLSFKIEVLWLAVVVAGIGVFGISSAVLMYNYAFSGFSDKAYTYIYDDRIEHGQISVFDLSLICVTVYYEDIESTRQDIMGNIVLKLNSVNSSIMTKTGKNKSQSEIKPKNNEIRLFFQSSEAKYYLIRELSRKIKYR